MSKAAYRPSRELRELVTAYCDGDVTAPQMERLQVILLADSGARGFFLEYMELHGELTWARSPDEQTGAVAREHCDLFPQEIPDEVFGPANDEPWPAELPGSLGGTTFGGWWFRTPSVVFVSIAGLAVLATVIAALWQGTPRQIPAPVAVVEPSPARPGFAALTETVDCVWEDGCDIRPGRLKRGEALSLRRGLAKIAFDDGAEVILEGPARLTIESATAATLQHGRLSANISGSHVDFTVYAPGMRVLDLGTVFGVNVDRDGRGQVHVFEGEVEVALTREDGRSLRSELLTKNDAASLDSGRQTIDRMRLDPAGFVRSLEPSDLDIRRDYVRAVKEAGPVAYWRFEYLDGGRVLNEMGDRYHGTSPTNLVLSPDVQNKTLSVDQRRDLQQYMMIEEPVEELAGSDYTLELWVKADQPLFASPITLYYTPSDKEDFIHERIASLIELLPVGESYHDQPEQSIRFLHRVPASWAFQREGNCYSAQPYEPGRWHHVVAVCDGTHIRLFVDGVLNDSQPAKKKHPDAPFVSIGRPPGSIHAERRVRDREMVGQIDEVAIYDWALSPEEIERHYRLGSRGFKSREPVRLSAGSPLGGR